MPINQLYRTWIQRICELRPGQRITQVKNFAWLVVGIFHSRSVQLSRIAGKIPSAAKTLSTVRRLSRFLDNPAVRVREWYEPMARHWLALQRVRVGEIRLIVDGTQVGCAHQLLMVSLAYRQRAVPLAWSWIRLERGHSRAHQQLALLQYVKGLLPRGAAVFLVGDNEFGSLPMLKQLDQWHWFYVLRQKPGTGVYVDRQTGWQTLGHLVQQPGQSVWLAHALLSKRAIYPVSVLIHWGIGQPRLWCLATNLPEARLTLRYYQRRMWIEEMFGDLKRHGFDLHTSMLRHFSRLSRLTLAVAFLYAWLLMTGRRTVQAGLRPLVDRKDRRDLSLFQIGLRWIERRICNSLPVSVSLFGSL